MKKIVTVFPDCEYCKGVGGLVEKAIYYAPTKYGKNRMLCERHFGEHGTSTKESEKTIRLVYVGALGEK